MSTSPKLNMSVIKSLKILECLFSGGLSGMQLKQISKATDLPGTTTWRLLYTLKAQGWVIDTPGEEKSQVKWRISEKVARLAAGYKRQALSDVQYIEMEYLKFTGENLRNE